MIIAEAERSALDTDYDSCPDVWQQAKADPLCKFLFNLT